MHSRIFIVLSDCASQTVRPRLCVPDCASQTVRPRTLMGVLILNTAKKILISSSIKDICPNAIIMIRTNKELLDYISKYHNSDTISEQTYLPFQTIIEQEKRVNSVYIIKSGIAKCFLTEENGNDFVEEFFGEGEIVGEIEIINNHVSVCEISTITKLCVYKISETNFKHLLETDKIFNQLILKALSAKIRYKASRHAHNQLNDVEANLRRIKKEFPEMFNAIPKLDIANYLGVTLRSLNRVLSDLKKRELI
jgi:CRP-like cAMP-binding protein